MSSRPGEQLFVVRTWLESPDDVRSMRGSIDHLASGRRAYFSNFGDLCDFVATAQAVVPTAADERTSDTENDRQR